MSRTILIALLVLLGLFAVSAFANEVTDLAAIDDMEMSEEMFLELDADEHMYDAEDAFLEADADADADAETEADAEAETEAEAGEEQTAVTKCGKKITWERNEEPQPESADHALVETETETESEKPVARKRTPGKPVTRGAAPRTAAAPAAASSSSVSACRKSEAAAAYATTHVSPKQFGQGQCAKFVGNALTAAGIRSIVGAPNACQKGPALAAAGFVKLPNLNSPKIGDVWMWSCVSAHPSGHLQILSKRGWVSDHIQNRNNPWKGGATGGSTATAWRLAPNRC